MALNENNDSVTENQVLLYVFYLENFLYKIDLLKKCTLEDRKKHINLINFSLELWNVMHKLIKLFFINTSMFSIPCQFLIRLTSISTLTNKYIRYCQSKDFPLVSVF